MPDDRLIVALDHVDLDESMRLVDQLGDRVSFYKVGLTAFTASGHVAVRELRARGKRVFLDLKLHDIPAQVAGAVASAVELGVALLTVHVAGGGVMMEAAARAASRSQLLTLGVTVLTSQEAAPGEVLTRAAAAIDCGLDGVVASPLEAAALRSRLGAGPLIVTPGIRPAGALVEADDQARVATPRAALNAGASHLVVGRPITAAADPVVAAVEILETMHGALNAG